MLIIEWMRLLACNNSLIVRQSLEKSSMAPPRMALSRRINHSRPWRFIVLSTLVCMRSAMLLLMSQKP